MTHPEFYEEPIELLLPGGPGYVHDTGKEDEYCLQYTNGTNILSKYLNGNILYTVHFEEKLNNMHAEEGIYNDPHPHNLQIFI